MRSKQGSHFWFMSFTQSAPGRGVSTHYRSGSCNLQPGATRLDMFSILRTYVDETWPDLAGASVIAFDIQPNKI